MTSVQFHYLIRTVKDLSAEEKRTLLLLLSQELEAATPPTSEQNPESPIQFGWAKGLITIAPDFDEPLEDFKEYME